eukprot:scaffold1650_cov351-Prasinococcus_capsulatus_cf.AAC.13
MRVWGPQGHCQPALPPGGPAGAGGGRRGALSGHWAPFWGRRTLKKAQRGLFERPEAGRGAPTLPCAAASAAQRACGSCSLLLCCTPRAASWPASLAASYAANRRPVASPPPLPQLCAATRAREARAGGASRLRALACVPLEDAAASRREHSEPGGTPSPFAVGRGAGCHSRGALCGWARAWGGGGRSRVEVLHALTLLRDRDDRPAGELGRATGGSK